MKKRIIAYFSDKHLMTNFLVIIVLIGGIYFGYNINKEELPDISFDFFVITVRYPGATPDEVEYFVTKPIEDAIKGLDGIHRITSTSNIGSSSIRIELDTNNNDRDSIINEIRATVLDVKLPDDITDEPRFRSFETSKKAIIDVAVVNKDVHLLNIKTRKELQALALTLENQLLNLSEISTINRSGFLQEEIQVNLLPEKLINYNISIETVMRKIKAYNVRQPAGTLEDLKESKITLSSPLYTIAELKELVIQGGFEGQKIRLKQVAEIINTFEKNKSITKVNGNEAIILNVVKTGSSGILKAMEKVRKTVKSFEKNNLKNSPYKIYLLDDESKDVRNRIEIITANGLIGFILIITTLFIFLDFRSGFWVAMGIPFTFCFTIIIAYMLGYTINNITLSAVIIVMGMIADDAIVVAENVSRLKSENVPEKKAVIDGTATMFLPIVASILTTCVAFIPLLAMSGRFAKMIIFIPVIVYLMLSGSLLESLFILPGHLQFHLPTWFKNFITLGLRLLYIHLFKRNKSIKKRGRKHWFFYIENIYGFFLKYFIKFKYITLLLFLGLLVFALQLFLNNMKYVMFPNEEATEIRFSAEAPKGTTRYQTAMLSKNIENIFMEYIDKEIVGFRTSIARNRWGRAVGENNLRMRIELKDKEERSKTVNELIAEWQNKLKKLNNFTNIRFSKQRFGHSSGNPIEIAVLENNDKIRKKIIDEIFHIMENDTDLINVEIERDIRNPEYKIKIKRDILEGLSIDPAIIGVTLRTILDGTILYEIPNGNEDIDLKLTVKNSEKTNIKKVLNVPVSNKGNYLVPLKNLVDITKTYTPNSISREKYKRITKIFSDINKKSHRKDIHDNYTQKNGNRRYNKGHLAEKSGETEEKTLIQKIIGIKNTFTKLVKKEEKTPLEIAEYYENNVFPKIISKYPSATVFFDGEVKETRESQGEFKWAIVTVIILIYMILGILFNSLSKPIIVMFSIPFGVVGVIIAFYYHGILVYGFMAVIGVLGLAGVAVNDAIIMLVKLDTACENKNVCKLSHKQVADVAKTRLRAVILTTLTTVAGLFPTAYGVAGYDSMLSEMMLAMGWGLIFATCITLVLIPCIYSLLMDIKHLLRIT